MKRIIFICTGNTCRSPMAEAIAKNIFEAKNIKANVFSRGLSVFTGSPMSDYSAMALEKHNISFSSHCATPLSKEDIISSDLILTMTNEHKNILLSFDSSLYEKVFTIYEYITGENKNIQDPFGKDYSAYENCYNELYSLINKLKFKEMSNMIIGLGCDHGGIGLKKVVIEYLEKNNITYKDFGTNSEESVDYPIYGKLVANAVSSGEVDKGIIICGTGIGISITANKVKGVRAALCHDVFSAKATREHNDANILAMGARVVGPGLALEIVDAFLTTDFSNDERHIRRINMIEQD